MGAKNKEVCHGCRKSGHYLLDCPTKKSCPICGKGIQKYMEVEKMTENLDWLFFCCTNDCTHFKWLNEDKYCQYKGQSSATSEVHKLSGLLKHVAKITENNDMDIPVKFTFRKRK